MATIVCAQCSAIVPDASLCGECEKSTLLEGRYKLLHAVGSGSFGTTYRAIRIFDSRPVAVKEMLVRRADSIKALELFEREARVLEKLNHPGIPEYLEDFVHEAGRSTAFFLVQEFVDGQSLDRVFGGASDVKNVFAAGAKVLNILEYLHALAPPVIHRDIKPQNIIQDKNGKLVLIDFGSVKAALELGEGSTVAGTFGYMPPEQFMAQASPKSDIYALGATLIALLSGADPQRLLNSERRFNLKPLGLDQTFENILMWMVDPEPSARPSASEASAVIQDALKGKNAMVLTRKPTSLMATDPHIMAILRAQTPRNLPKEFSKVYLTESQFSLTFGLLFGGLGGGIPGLLGIFLTLVPGVPFWVSVMVFGMALIFATIGSVAAFSGITSRKAKANIWRNGIPHSAILSRVTDSTYSENDRNAHRYVYTYTYDGRHHEGYWDSWTSQKVQVGDEVPILVNPEKPSESLMLVIAPR